MMLSSGGFKFNFQLDNESLQNDVVEVTEAKEVERQCHYSAAPVCELFIEPFHHDLVSKYKFTTLESGDAPCHVKYASSESIMQHIDTLKTSDNHKLPSCSGLLEAGTDLVPGVYEGGLKIWEGSCDLLNYLCTGKVDFNDARILEVGCGAGLPGILAMLQGASCVAFQDYNPGVLHLSTIPNVLANITKQSMPSVTFFSGDWTNLVTYINPDDKVTLKYDIVLTSETIYCVDSQPKLLELIKKHVKPCTGRALIAAKSHYFGVGGSMEMFKMLVRKDGFFKYSLCMTVTQCSVPREVILLEQV